MKTFKTKLLGRNADYLAPDGSEIRLLPNGVHGSLAHCTLSAGSTTKAVRHKTVEEIWYFISGQGEVWRKEIKFMGDEQGVYEEVVPVKPGTSLTIPVGVHFQFRNTGEEPLQFIIATMPPWPGPEEAVVVADHWPN